MEVKIDAYQCQIKDTKIQRVRNATIYTVIGIDLQGNKDLYGNSKDKEWRIFSEYENSGCEYLCSI